MTSDEFGQAYSRGYSLTVRFLISRGLSCDNAQETAQAAWAKGWERLGQLRDQNMILTWMNSIALNLHRSRVRKEPLLQALPELTTPSKINVSAIDLQRVLKVCRRNERLVLERHYLEGVQSTGNRPSSTGGRKPRCGSGCCGHGGAWARRWGAPAADPAPTPLTVAA